MAELDTAAIRANWDPGYEEGAVIHGLCDALDAARAALALTATHLASARAELERLRAGEDPTPVPENAWPTPGQWLRRFNDAGPELRLEVVRLALDDAETAQRCLIEGHRPRLVEALTDRNHNANRAANAEAALARVKAAVGDGDCPRGYEKGESGCDCHICRVRAALAGDDRQVTATSDDCPADPDQLIKDVSASAWDDCAAWVQRMAENTDAEYAVRRVAQFNPYRAALSGPPVCCERRPYGGDLLHQDDCPAYLAMLGDSLDDLERTDPDVRAAAESYDAMVERVTGRGSAAREEIEHQTARAEKAEAALGLILSVGFHPYVDPLPLEYGCAHVARKGDGQMTCGAHAEHPVHVHPKHAYAPGALCCGMPKHDPIHGAADPSPDGRR